MFDIQAKAARRGSAESRMWGLIAAAILAALAVASATLVFRDDGEAADHARPAESVEARAAWQAAVRRGIAQANGSTSLARWPFSSIPVHQDGAPHAVEQSITGLLGPARPLGLRFDAARSIVTARGQRIWVVPGRAVICMFRTPRLASSCDTATNASRRGLVLVTYKIGKDPKAPPRNFELLGLVPDGFHSATLKIGARRVQVRASTNTISYRAKAPISVLAIHR